MSNSKKIMSHTLAWFVHFLTASGAILALWGFKAISEHNFTLTLKILVLTVIIEFGIMGCLDIRGYSALTLETEELTPVYKYFE